MDVAGEGLGGGLREADFHGGERAGVVGADGVRGRLAGVAVEAAGDVDGELLGGLGVHPVDGGVERRARFAAGAGAEQGVDEPGGVVGVLVELRSRFAESMRTCIVPAGAARLATQSMIGTSALLQDGEVGGGVAA